MNRLVYAVFLFVTLACCVPIASVQSASNLLTMNQWVHLDSEGTLNGRVLLTHVEGQATIPATMTVLVRDESGSTFSGKTDGEGKFVFNDLKPGIYTLIANGDSSFASAALHVLPENSRSDDGFPSVAEISAAKIQDRTVQEAIARYLPPKSDTATASIDSADLKNLADQIYGSELSQVIQTRGGMKGNIYVAGAIGDKLQIAHRTNIFLFQDGAEVARTLTDESGRFEIDQLAVGHYSLLAIGRDGIGSIGFVLVDETQALETARRHSASNDKQTLVMEYGCCGVQQEFAMQIAPAPAVMEMVESPMFQDSCGCAASVPVPACGCAVPIDPCGCGGVVEESVVEGTPVTGAGTSAGYGGGGGGGFGGYGGGGGFGLSGLGALGGLGAILATTGSNGGGAIITAPILPPIVASSSSPTDDQDEAEQAQSNSAQSSGGSGVSVSSGSSTITSSAIAPRVVIDDDVVVTEEATE